MNFELKVRNIVVVGMFNPLVFDKYFFIKNGLVPEELLSQKQVFLPDFVQVATPDFHLTINTIQMILTAPKPEVVNNDIARVLIDILEIAKEMNVVGSGINFNWFVSDDKDIKSLPAFSKRLFFNSDNKIQNQVFNEEDATFGFYSSKDVLNTRLKLDVKPIIFKQNIQSLEESAVHFQFNFHKDYLQVDKSKFELIELLKQYERYRIETEKIIKLLV